MSTWTSSLHAALLTLAVSAALPAAAAPERRMPVFGGAVVLAAPAGYCADIDNSSDGERTAFALFASCASLGGAGAPRRPALLTATVVNGGASRQPLAVSFGDMAVFFQSERGRAMLARSGRAADVEVRRITVAGEVMFLRLEDRSRLGDVEVLPGYWRAILPANGRVVSLSVLSPAALPLTEIEQRRTLDEFVGRVQSANRRR